MRRRRKPLTLTQRVVKVASNVSKKARKRARSFARPVQKYLKSNSLSRTARRNQKRALRQAKKIRKGLRRGLRKLPGRSRKAQRLFKRTLRITRKNTTSFFKARTRARKQAATLAKRARTQMDLTGSVDISTARITQASGDPGASRPGEPPKMRTGKGRDAIKAQLRLKGKKLNSRVYVDKKIAAYMAMWEFRKDGKQRPFLKPSLENNLNEFGKIIGNELRQGVSGARKKAVVK